MSGLTLRRPGSPPKAAVVHIVDDNEAVRCSVALLLRYSGYEAEMHGSAEGFLQVLGTMRAGCAIIDIFMPGMDGLELQTELHRRGTTMPVIIATGHGDISLVVRAMKVGAIDFLEKPYRSERLSGAVAAAMDRYKGGSQQQETAAAAERRVNTLTPRDGDVLRLLMGGWLNKIIANELNISLRAVEVHRATIMEKLGCRSLTEAVCIATAAGFRFL